MKWVVTYFNLLDPASGNSTQLEIKVAGDMNFARPRWADVSGNNLTNPNVSPNGKRAHFRISRRDIHLPKGGRKAGEILALLRVLPIAPQSGLPKVIK